MTHTKCIIDEVDVSGCDFYNDCRCSAQEHYAEGEFLWAEECEECPDCYYKQLKRKEQECERYYTALEDIKHILKIYEKELEECLCNNIDEKILVKINEALGDNNGNSI